MTAVVESKKQEPERKENAVGIKGVEGSNEKERREN